MKNIFLTIICTFLITACNANMNNRSAQTTVKTPVTVETLLDVSSEKVSFAVDSEKSLNDLADWVNNDQPTRAEINCNKGNFLCMRAGKILASFGVPYQHSKTGASLNSVALYYERVTATDCETSNKSIYPVFGCSVAANMIQMVGDYQQFTKPNLLSHRDASKAVGHLNLYERSNSSR